MMSFGLPGGPRQERSDGLEHLRPSYVMGRAANDTATDKTTTRAEKQPTKDDMPVPAMPLLPWWARVLCWSLLWIIVIITVCCLYALFSWCCVPMNPAPGEIQELKARKERELGRPVDVYWNAKSRQLMWAQK